MLRQLVLLMGVMGLAWVVVANTPEPRPFGEKVMCRGQFENARIRFEQERKGTVAFIGGSITEMDGYRPMVCSILQKRFPNTEFTFIPAGISSTCSTTGAFRLADDVLSKGCVDLLFVEFAVNDDQDAHHDRASCIRGMEGLIRHARQVNPAMDIVITYFVNESILSTLQSGETPLSIAAHRSVAEHYKIPTIHLAQEVADEIAAGTLTWKQFGGVHPAPHGNAICARMIDELFSRFWSMPLPRQCSVTAHPLPEAPLDPFHYGSGRFIDPAKAHVVSGWTLGVPLWKDLPGSKRGRFCQIPMLSATQPKSELTLAFEGNAVGAYIVAGPDAGVAQASIDEGPFVDVNLYHAYSKGLHYPRTVMLGYDLKTGAHTLTLRIASTTESAGHAMRIIKFVAN